MNELKDKASIESAITKVDDLYNELDAIRNSEFTKGDDVHSLGGFQQNLIGIKYLLENMEKVEEK